MVIDQIRTLSTFCVSHIRTHVALFLTWNFFVHITCRQHLPHTKITEEENVVSAEMLQMLQICAMLM